jgi:hypothetical protein
VKSGQAPHVLEAAASLVTELLGRCRRVCPAFAIMLHELLTAPIGEFCAQPLV